MIIMCIATIFALYLWGIGALMGIYFLGCVTMLALAACLALVIIHIIKAIVYDMIEQVADQRVAQQVIVTQPRRRKRKQQIQHITVQGNALIVDPKQLTAATTRQQLSTNAMVVRK